MVIDYKEIREHVSVASTHELEQFLNATKFIVKGCLEKEEKFSKLYHDALHDRIASEKVEEIIFLELHKRAK
jgi:hypothetical protein